MRRLIVPLILLAGSKAFAGGSMGGTPPSIRSDAIEISTQEFNRIAIESILNPNREVLVHGEVARPKIIDIQNRLMKFETNDMKLIEVTEY